MGTDALHYKVGGVSYPLATGTGRTLLQDADPALFYLLDYLSSMVTALVGDRLVADASASNAPIAEAVAQQLPYDPQPYLQTGQYRFPLLAVFRRRGAYDMKTVTQWHRIGELGLTYVLPPLTAGQAEAVLPILHAVSNALVSAIEVGAYPTYTPPGGAAAQSVTQLAGIAEAGVQKDQYGLFPGTGGLVFPAWTATLSIHEQRGVVSGYDALGAVDMHEDLVRPGDQSKMEDFVVDYSDVEPAPTGFSGPVSIESVSPATGTAAGGTTVTLTGGNFFAGCSVSFDGVAATGVSVVDSHHVTCVTPAHAAGVVNVAVVNASGTYGLASNAFTYT